MERYRSGHNEAVLKTVCPKGRVGSNPTLSAERKLYSFLFVNIAEADKGAEIQHRFQRFSEKAVKCLKFYISTKSTGQERQYRVY